MSASDHRSFGLRERRSRRLLATVIATAACMALIVPAPVAGAAPLISTLTTQTGILPFAGDVFTTGSNGSLIAVDPSSTQLSAPLSTWLENR